MMAFCCFNKAPEQRILVLIILLYYHFSKTETQHYLIVKHCQTLKVRTINCVRMAADDSQGGEDEMPEAVQQRIIQLKALHEEREKTMKQYLLERAKLEAKYQALMQPLYDKRAEIVSGNALGDSGDDAESERGIPQFWVLTMAQMDVVGDVLTEKDIACLESLQNIQCIDNEEGDGFTLIFHFVENDFFENSILTKKYQVPNLLLGSEPMLKGVEGCDIQWKEEQCLTFTKVTQKQRGKGKNKGQIRNVVKKERQDSFFHFFSTPTLPSLDSMNEEEALRLEAEFNMDYDIAQALRSQIVPKAFLWYTGMGEQEMEAVLEDMVWPEGQKHTTDEEE